MTFGRFVAILLSTAFLAFGRPSTGCTQSLPHAELQQTSYAPQFHDSTHWNIEPSFKYDVLTFLNVLTADSFYTPYYPGVYERFAPLLTPEVRRALAGLKRKIKDEGKGIVSAFLTLYFSASSSETLEEMRSDVRNSGNLRRVLRTTEYYSEEGWARYESIRAELEIIFSFLIDIHFSTYWDNNIKPIVEKRISDIEARLPEFNVVKAVESHLGRALPSNEITVYMLYYSQPHGIKITGSRYLTDVAWHFAIVIRNAVHEMMHPPYDLKTDSVLSAVLDRLRGDSYLIDKVEHHNPSFGYNSFEGFVEEDVVQASDQIISERLGIANDALARWTKNDDGMHVLAVALYRVMKMNKFGETDESLRDFLVRQIESGSLMPGQIQRLNEAFRVESSAK